MTITNNKVYVVSGCTAGDYGSAQDDPRSLLEGGQAWFGAPQLIGVFSTAGLALEAGIHEILIELKDGIDEVNCYSIDEAHWVGETGHPYHEHCPLRKLHDYSRPSYTVFLMDAATRGVFDTDDAWACVVVQELELDFQKID